MSGWIDNVGIASLFVIGTIMLVIVSYIFARWLVGDGGGEESRALANSVASKVAALHALLLALAFAQQMLLYHNVKHATVAEADSLANVYYNIDRHGAAPQNLHDVVRSYAEASITEEWGALARGDGLMQGVWHQWEKIYIGVLDLSDATARQASVRSNMLDDIRAVAKARDRRAGHAVQRLSPLFWTAAAFGLILVAVAHYGYRPTWLNLCLLSIFSGYTGVILFLIFAFANPYSEPGALRPVAIESLVSKF